MIRVFPRKTKWTPTDSLAFVGEPRLFRPPEQPVHISVTFTWDIPEAERLYRSWTRFYSDVQLGGPAFCDCGAEFIPGRFVADGITFTSRGCSKTCDFCLAWRREGTIRELPIVPGNNIADNNLLACSRDHIERVFAMLQSQHGVKFSGGLDAEILQQWHVDLLKQISLTYAWFSCDYPGAIANIDKVADLMADFPIHKKRCYVLIGFNGESIKSAEKRLESVYKLGFLPFAMLYRDESIIDNRKRDWSLLAKKWCRPAAYRGRKNDAGRISDENNKSV